MQSKSTFPARIAPTRENGSASGTENRSSGKRGLTLHCCISITEEVKINGLQKSIGQDSFTCISILRYSCRELPGF